MSECAWAKYTSDPSTAKALLADLKSSSSDRRAIEVIDSALSEAASGFPPPSAAAEFAKTFPPGALTRGLPGPSPPPAPAPVVRHPLWHGMNSTNSGHFRM
jgi:hypothetical protein